MPSLAKEIAEGFNHPPRYFPWWADAQACEELVAGHQAKAVAVAA